MVATTRSTVTLVPDELFGLHATFAPLGQVFESIEDRAPSKFEHIQKAILEILDKHELNRVKIYEEDTDDTSEYMVISMTGEFIIVIKEYPEGAFTLLRCKPKGGWQTAVRCQVLGHKASKRALQELTLSAHSQK